jgi:hypothetical protein
VGEGSSRLVVWRREIERPACEPIKLTVPRC